MEGVKFKIFLLFRIFSCCYCDAPEISPDQAMQMASKMKACTPVQPGTNLGNYKENMLGTWYVVKMYDAPMEENHPIPPFVFLKNPVTGQVLVEGNAPPLGAIRIPLDLSLPGRLDMNHNMSVPVMGTPMELSLSVKGTLLDIEASGKYMLLHGCGRLLGPEYQMTATIGRQKAPDPAYEAKIMPILKSLGLVT